MEWFYCFMLFAPVVARKWMLEDQRDHLLELNHILTEQVMMHQLFLEERTRSGGSGIKQVRQTHDGTREYMSESFTGKNFYAMHNHPNHMNTVGVGEISVAMNGIEFKTSHNDYKINMPSTTSKEFNAMEKIPHPDVPPSVLAKSSADEQILEMKEWFKAWRDQNYTARDYRKYFKPILCYLEGAWMHQEEKVRKLYESDRHEFDAVDWRELHQKSRFTAYSGWKDPNENYPYLPTTILEIKDGTTPVVAQWNFRILCHPLKNDLPLNRFHFVDDLKNRMNFGAMGTDSYHRSSAIRFDLNPSDSDLFVDKEYTNGLLDKLMAEIPGKDNYGSFLEDNLFGKNMAYDNFKEDLQPLNAAYYHRFYKTPFYDMMGFRTRNKGFNDPNLFMAMTTQKEVAGMKVDHGCYQINKVKRVCQSNDEQKWTYAIPLEIIYLTPLSKWNPYDITIHEADENKKSQVVADGRNGGMTKDTAYNGSDYKAWHITPSCFYCSSEINLIPADTVKTTTIGVLNKNGELTECAATGIRILFPDIPSVGVLRQRYPIAAPAVENLPEWKEMEALRDLIMNSASYSQMFTGATSLRNVTTQIKLKESVEESDIDVHSHLVHLTEDEVSNLNNGATVYAYTSYDMGHAHALSIIYSKSTKQFEYSTCDSQTAGGLCPGQHAKVFQLIEKPIPYKVWINITTSYGKSFHGEI